MVLLMMLHPTQELEPPANPARVTLAIWYTSLRYNHAPVDVVQFDLMAPDARPDAWINDREMSLTWRYLNSDAPRLILNDKVDFAAFCGEHGFPTPPILQHWEKGTRKHGSSSPWRDSIVEKPVRGAVGRGIRRWKRTGNGYTDGNLVLSNKAMLAHLAEASSTQALILQPEVLQHPTIADIAAGGAPVARVITGRPTSTAKRVNY